jgi:uncharacterized protein YndB with AHSA1/START domain
MADMAPHYRFRQRAWVPAPPERVREVLVDLADYPRWWPQVVAVATLGPDDARVLCRSRLPYTLDLVLHAVSRELPTVEVSVTGQLRGWVRWTLTPEADGTAMALEQEVTVHGLLAPIAALARPLLRWNHARMVADGLAGLTARLR